MKPTLKPHGIKRLKLKCDTLLLTSAFTSSLRRYILVCLVVSFVATNIRPVRKESDIETVLKTQLALTTILLTAVVYILALVFLPESFDIARVSGAGDITFTPIKAWGCVCAGLWSGCIIGRAKPNHAPPCLGLMTYPNTEP